MIVKCWLCSGETQQKPVQLRSKKQAIINYCSRCHFEFFNHENISLLSTNQLDKTRLESAGLDIPKQEKDFQNGYNQSQAYIKEYISIDDIGKNILEIGCSWGYFLKALQEKGCVPYGIEINPVRAQFVQSNLHITCVEDLEKYISKNIKFKKIFSFYCLEYIINPIKYFKTIVSMLEENGEIIFITPNLDDVLKDIWCNEGYKNFFYDECAVAYYSLNAVNSLFATLKKNMPNISGVTETRQGYTIYNHLHWYFNNKPVNNNVLVGGDRLLENIQESLYTTNSKLGEGICSLLNDFEMKYQEMIEKHNYGNQILIKIKKW